jgi:hypothetical protein
VHQILTEDLGKRKVCARFVPHALSGDEKHARVEHRSWPKVITKFTKSIITGDETPVETQHDLAARIAVAVGTMRENSWNI